MEHIGGIIENDLTYNPEKQQIEVQKENIKDKRVQTGLAKWEI